MGYLLPGGKLRRFGDSLMPGSADVINVPITKPIQTGSLLTTQGRIATARSATAAADINRTAPTFNDPRYSFTTLSIPTDLRTLNGLYRFFDDTDPVVGNALRLHTEFPLSRVSMKEHPDPVIQSHYEEMWNRISMEKLLFDVALEYWRIGNVFPYGAWNINEFMWDQFVILNPDYVTVEGTYLNKKPFIKLQPDEHLKKVVTTGQPKFLYDQLPREIIKYVRMGQEIPLSSQNVFHVSHNKAPYETLGRSIIKRILKSLIYEDRMSMANFAIATRQTIPITVVKIGDPNSVEEDHYVTFKENNILKVMTFKEMWDNYGGIITNHGENKQTKYVGYYNLTTLSQCADGSQKWNLIENILRHPTPDEVVEVKTPLSTLRMTEGHGLCWVNPDTLNYEHVNPIQLEKQENPTIISMDRFDYSTHASKIFEDISLTEDTVYFIGLWTADGCFEGWKNKSGKHVSTKKVKISSNNQGIGNNLITKYGATRYKYTRDTVYNIRHNIVEKLVDYYGMHQGDSISKTGKEKVPQEILFNSNNKIVAAFLAGLFDGDGYLNKKIHNIGAVCGASKEFMHWISLSLLAKGIQSQIVFRSNAWEVLISGKNNILKYLDLIQPYIKHSVKILRAKKYRDHFEISRSNQDKTYIHNLTMGNKEKLFSTSEYRLSSGMRPFTYVQNLKYINTNFTKKAAISCPEKSTCVNLFGVAVNKISRKQKNSEFVYDLMLKDTPHYYLIAHKGWGLSGNSGWVPNDAELDEFRELLSAREVDPNFCYDEETECLTDRGWVNYTELTYDHKIASFNPKGNHLEYHKPQAITIQDYDDDMIHFKTRKIDCKVTPNHRMWVKRDNKWQVILAQDVVETDILRTTVEGYEHNNLSDTLDIAGKKVGTGDFFEFIGWYISEGSISSYGKTNKNYGIHITQTKNGSFDAVENIMKKLPWKYTLYQDCQFVIDNISLGDYLEKEFGKGSNKKKLPRWILDAPPEYLERLFISYIEGDGTAIKTKRDIFYQACTASKQLADNLQEIGIKLGYAVSLGSRQPEYYIRPSDGKKVFKKSDGSDFFLLHRLNFSKDSVSKFPSLKRRKDYNTPLKQELVSVGEIPRKGKRIDWTNFDLKSVLAQTNGYAPQAAQLLGCSVDTVLNQMKILGIEPKKVDTRLSKYEGTDNIQRVPYKGKIWCVSVPPGIILTRRQGYPMVAGQTIVYHWGIDIQFYGAAGKIWNLTNEFNRIMKWKLLGLGISEALLTGAGSYASAYAQLEVLRQRYLHFQHTLQTFVYRGIFEPVAKQCGFYKTQDTVAGKYYHGQKYGSPDNKIGKVEEQIRKHSTDFDNLDSQEFLHSLLRTQASNDSMVNLEYPELDWDLLSLSNDVQYRNFLMNLDRLFPGQRKVSDSTFYAAAKLDKDAEKAKLKLEHEESLKDMLEKGRISKKYAAKFAEEGIPFPGEQKGADQQGQSGGPGGPAAPGASPGPGGMSIPPGGAPPLGGTGGGNLQGVPAQVPNAPIGKNNFDGAPSSPEASRLRSMKIHEQLTASINDIQKENDEELTRLTKFNKTAGIDIDKIDADVKDLSQEKMSKSKRSTEDNAH